MEDTRKQVREFYDQVGWSQVDEGLYQNARFEDLRHPPDPEGLYQLVAPKPDHAVPPTTESTIRLSPTHQSV